MPLGLIGKKIGHTRVYNSEGICLPVTVVQVGPNHVLQVKKQDSTIRQVNNLFARCDTTLKSGPGTWYD